ncbi:MAG: glycoside hydrolase family 88 protein [Prevotellaceae bacterium]|nr:glycoside hydrolase family 88 protein [Prevotellaceae bacterium]
MSENIRFAASQTDSLLAKIGDPHRKEPRTINADGKVAMVGIYDWTSGFFPGNLWYIYELTGDSIWRKRAEEWTAILEPLKTFTGHHDLGFMMFCSYGNGFRLTGNEQYKEILLETANSLASRFSPATSCIKSWNGFKPWTDTIKCPFPVIIDNMMNLELLLWAAKTSGNNELRDIALTHAKTTMANHLRPDFSTYHVVCYDTITGEVTNRNTHQGFADNSTWARGQAWGTYGFTMMFRETGDSAYLQTAKNLADFFINHPNLPADKVPYWDFDAGRDGFVSASQYKPETYPEQPRDASAAAVAASALFDLSIFLKDRKYFDAAETILHSLASPAYRAQLGANGGFLLEHCVGSIPHNSEINVPLVYADYYFLEALGKYKKSK